MNKKEKKTILGLETSCDETAAAVIRGENGRIEVLSNIISSQIDIHQKYGGVVPEVAAREHVINILPVISEALKKAGISRGEASKKISAIAVASGPGLITSLITGVETAKCLSYAWKIPLVEVNHIEGHIYSNFIGEFSIFNPERSEKFPILILTVSGGHNLLVLMKTHGKYEVIGETRDDAAGEAFDKAAKLLNLGYPGGPVISKYAAEFYKQKAKNSNLKSQISNKSETTRHKLRIVLPRPMINSGDFDFSFSGLKTALLYEVKKYSKQELEKLKLEICYEFQQAIIDVLISKSLKAAKKHQVKTIMLSGGVSANFELRRQMAKTIKEQISDACFLIPDLNYTTDNAAMIAAAGYYKVLAEKYIPWRKIKADCNFMLK